jgi:hypothetical protein
MSPSSNRGRPTVLDDPWDGIVDLSGEGGLALGERAALQSIFASGEAFESRVAHGTVLIGGCALTAARGEPARR